MPQDMQDLSSPTRGKTWAPAVKILITELPGNSQFFLFLNVNLAKCMHIVDVQLSLWNLIELIQEIPMRLPPCPSDFWTLYHTNSKTSPICSLGHSTKESLKCLRNSLLIIIIHDFSSPSQHTNMKCNRKTDFNYSGCLTLPVHQIIHTPLPWRLSSLILSTGEHEQGANYSRSAHQELESKYNYHMPIAQEIRMLFNKARLILCVPYSYHRICSYLLFLKLC